MLSVIRADGTAERQALRLLRSRSGEVDREVTAVVTQIIETVRQKGDAALKQYAQQFDGVVPAQMEVPKEEIQKALSTADKDFIGSLRRAQENIAAFHAWQKQQSFLDAQPNGVILGQRVRGLRRVGLYVPGGTAAYPSSVLMNAVPARIAGVGELIMVTPPDKNGKANPDILAAAAIAGIDRVFLAGGAQAVAALAYGTETIPPVDKIVGPGNIYVATAKKLLYGQVDIDMIAGPSEILVVADETADPVYLAADLMSQAEHDRLASAILLCTQRTDCPKNHRRNGTAVFDAFPAGDHFGLAGKLWRSHCLPGLGSDGGIGQRNRARAFGSYDPKPVGNGRPVRKCRLGVLRALFAGTAGRLLCGAKPCAADQRHGTVFFAPVGG